MEMDSRSVNLNFIFVSKFIQKVKKFTTPLSRSHYRQGPQRGAEPVRASHPPAWPNCPTDESAPLHEKSGFQRMCCLHHSSSGDRSKEAAPLCVWLGQEEREARSWKRRHSSRFSRSSRWDVPSASWKTWKCKFSWSKIELSAMLANCSYCRSWTHTWVTSSFP